MSRALMRLRPGRRITSESGSFLRYFRPATLNAEYPRGITSDYDVLVNEATGAATTRDGSGSFLWDWKTQRVGGARHAAITSGKRIVISGSGSAAGDALVSAYNTALADTGDYEFLVPADVQIIGDAEAGWTMSTGSGDQSTRRFFFTFNGTLPTADVMPSEATLAACCVMRGRDGAYASSVIRMGSHLLPKTTWTGITVQPQGDLYYFGIFEVRNASATTLAEHPSGHIWDRCKMDADVSADCRSGILLQGFANAVLETWITGVYSTTEGKGIGGYSGVKHNYFRRVYGEARAEGFLLGGGADPVVCDGTCDPSDNFSDRCVAAKKAAWMSSPDGANGPGTAIGGLKNGFETKNCRRWLILNCITYRACNTGQSHSMIFQNLVEGGDQNGPYNCNADIIVLNHVFRDIQNGLNVVSRISYGIAPPVNPSARIAFVNIRMENLGKSFGTGGYQCNPMQITGDIQGLLLDKWTWIMDAGSEQNDVLRSYAAIASPNNWMFTNLAGRALAWYGTDIYDSTKFGLPLLDAEFLGSSVGYTWNGNAMFGTYQYGGTMTPGTTLYADATAMGFDTATGRLSGASLTAGVGGATPGCEHDYLDALKTELAWGFTR